MVVSLPEGMAAGKSPPIGIRVAVTFVCCGRARPMSARFVSSGDVRGANVGKEMAMRKNAGTAVIVLFAVLFCLTPVLDPRITVGLCVASVLGIGIYTVVTFARKS